MYIHFHYDEEGYHLLANYFKQTVIEKMPYIERITERILFLKREVDLHASAEVTKIPDVMAIREKSAQFGQNNDCDYICGPEIHHPCRIGLKKLFEDLVADEERLSTSMMFNWIAC